VAAPILPSLIEADISASTREYVPARANHTTQASSVEPMLDETVVIPAPPTSTRDLVLSSIRSPRTYGQNDANTRIVLRAVEDSWVQVRDHQDALLLTRVLRSGDTYYVPDRIGLTLLTGNAGGIAIEVDGVTLAPLGPVGAVRRQIALDPARLLDGTASPR
jgi:cytoskeleton protein RodZ